MGKHRGTHDDEYISTVYPRMSVSVFRSAFFDKIYRCVCGCKRHGWIVRARNRDIDLRGRDREAEREVENSQI